MHNPCDFTVNFRVKVLQVLGEDGADWVRVQPGEGSVEAGGKLELLAGFLPKWSGRAEVEVVVHVAHGRRMAFKVRPFGLAAIELLWVCGLVGVSLQQGGC